MKKLIYLIVLALILGLVLTGCTLLSNIGQVPTSEQSGMSYLTKGGGPEESNAEIFPLYAGQDKLVGSVKVWNDSDNLYVKYVMGEAPVGLEDELKTGWCLTETHLHVATTPEGIPQTKKGNPKPGKFEYKMEHSCVSEHLYTIERSLVPRDELYIAAHAVVSDASICEANGVMYATRISGGIKGLYEVDVVNGTSTLLKAITGSIADVNNGTGYTNGLAYDPFNQKLYFTAPPRVNVSPSPLWSYDIATDTLDYLVDLDGSVVGASFYDGAYYYIAEGVNSLMKVEVNSGNAVTSACSDFGTASDFTFGDFAISSTGMLYGSTRVAPKMFFSLDMMGGCSYNKFDGSNALDLQLAYGSDGKLYGINNANGYSYVIDEETGVATKLSFTFVGVADMASGELCVPNTETAWGGTMDFPGANWATYFTYTHDGCFILDITAINGKTGYTHYFTISYDPETENFAGKGTSPHAGNQSLSEIILEDNKISFRSDYDATSYFWFPSFILEDGGSLTFVDDYGSDNVTSATGTWEISYDCNGD